MTDDTAMALALADSLEARDDLDEQDLLGRFADWWQSGTYSCTGKCFDIGITTQRRKFSIADILLSDVLRLSIGSMGWPNSLHRAVMLRALPHDQLSSKHTPSSWRILQPRTEQHHIYIWLSVRCRPDPNRTIIAMCTPRPTRHSADTAKLLSPPEWPRIR